MAIRLGGKSGGGEDHDAEIVAEINITPLTDIFLVLLIIFMVTSSVMTNSGVDVSLPSASPETSQSQPEGIVVSLLPAGRMQVNGLAVAAGDYGTLETSLKKAFGMTKSRLVILEGDKEAFLGSAIEVMDSARKAGAEKFAIATSTGDGGRSKK
ncbi:MAG: biopolymer transporter ExbD [Cryobacterium sp.]|nr:biopolymer transporter ExbD [Oligoflexia bacterium]